MLLYKLDMIHYLRGFKNYFATYHQNLFRLLKFILSYFRHTRVIFSPSARAREIPANFEVVVCAIFSRLRQLLEYEISSQVSVRNCHLKLNSPCQVLSSAGA